MSVELSPTHVITEINEVKENSDEEKTEEQIIVENKNADVDEPFEIEDTKIDSSDTIQDLLSNYNLRKVKRTIIIEDVYDNGNREYVPEQKKTKKKEREKPVNRYKCNLCNNTFTSETTFNSHKIIHQTDMEYTCDLCKETFDTNKHLLKHKTTWHNDNDCYLCKKCKCAFSDHRSYTNHRIGHLKPPYKCFECNFQFTKKTSLQSHIFLHYNIQTECSVCKKMINHKRMLSHMEQHNRISCVECGKKVRKSFYSYHMHVHTGVKKYQCWYCGQGFFSSGQRITHTRKHTGERPYRCSQCSRSFTQCTDLNRHMSIHKKSASFDCDHCGKKYSIKQSLITHMRIHSNYKPYKCPFCSESFHTSTYLTLHTYKKHLKEKRFKCDVCNRSFKLKNDYRKHLATKEHHKMAYKHTINVKVEC
ncbi:zinc finger protein 436-like [Colias croceus]|uniref:zinc finger protein 436-like n=1 Tax=Colias crocea TaxID=72248 RepID=UPI001E27C85E|nr:zinc finger protein 436-like [Colias croceus]